MHHSFNFKVIFRLVLILANMIVLSLIFGDMRLFFNQIILGITLVIQIIEMIRYINHTNKELAKFLLAIRHDDLAISFHKSKLGRSFRELHGSFEEIVNAIKSVKIEKEAQFQYLKLAVNRVNIGIISIENNQDIVLFNNSGKSLLSVQGINNLAILKEKVPQFVKEINAIGEEGRKLVELKVDGDIKTLSLDVKSMVMLDRSYKHITFQDIRGEIEQKEIEAWHKLIRILTHEIMNSITPISSLTETMQYMLEEGGRQKPLENLDDEVIKDIRFSLKTIQKRSDGMLTFIDDYRKLTKVAKPQQEHVSVKILFEEISLLMAPQLEKEDIRLSIHVTPDDMSIYMDAHLMEQVLINMITNSRHALKNRPGGTIHLKAYREPQVTIEVEDNGAGINEKEIKEIFVPFFSTKKEGSGIGLSLSKQIMHLHEGNIKVRSTPGKGTTFQLSFKR
ncbi:ATP-binding protein [Fulvivirga sp. M361]|uniref:sensor histidine kinase n=1 Tax=Fulvivirga sp. M361 TaxID=2594266 RepID=UPI00117B4748|nr:ATP-binding protein [Fulvivirga sp. M361]TRX57572.1 ATP-binding protein [Fulvivirga sp. M361]